MSLQDSRLIETVKVLLKVGADGRGIASVEKTGTSGDVDTYTITLTDQTKYTFDVTNGASIDTIEKTGTSGAVDTYTITLTNGETFTFTVTNGVGTIASDIGYTNTTSQLSATNVQDALDEIAKPAFIEAQTRANIASGEKLSTIFGKIKKWFTDLNHEVVWTNPNPPIPGSGNGFPAQDLTGLDLSDCDYLRIYSYNNGTESDTIEKIILPNTYSTIERLSTSFMSLNEGYILSQSRSVSIGNFTSNSTITFGGGTYRSFYWKGDREYPYTPIAIQIQHNLDRTGIVVPYKIVKCKW